MLLLTEGQMNDHKGAQLMVHALPPATTLIADHSVAVDPFNGNIFVPLTGTGDDTLCPGGCIAVFAQQVPEPGSLSLLVVAMTGLVGYAGWRRRTS